MPDSWDYSQPRERTSPIPFAPLITGLIIALSIIFTIAFQLPHGETNTLWDRLARFGTVSPAEMWDGAYYVLFTSVFVHGSILHILFNMMWLYRLGTVLEASLRPWVYALFFITATIVASAVEIVIMGAPGIGASGAVYAMFGLMWAGRGAFPAWRQLATRDNMNIFLVWGVFCIFTTWAGYMPVANGAHFGGLVFGLAIGWLFYSPRRQPLWSIPLTILVVATICSVTWMPWSGPWTWWKGNRELERHHYSNAVTWYHRSIDRGESPDSLWKNIAIAWIGLSVSDLMHGQSHAGFLAMQQAQEAMGHLPTDQQKDLQVYMKQAIEAGIWDTVQRPTGKKK